MKDRIIKEINLLKSRYNNVEYVDNGHWIKIGSYHLPEGWNKRKVDVVFQIPNQYPGGQPYGFYTLSGLLYNGKKPGNYKEPSPISIPFKGNWGVFSWNPESGQWNPTADLVTGSNLLNWVIGFNERFRQGV